MTWQLSYPRHTDTGIESRPGQTTLRVVAKPIMCKIKK
jgi:hypothetical protein